MRPPGSTRGFPREWTEFLRSLTSHRVRFLVVGAHALARHGAVRATGDLDLWVEPTDANADRLAKAFADFGYAATANAAYKLAQRDRMATLGVPPLRIDVMSSVSGLDFDEAFARRVDGRLGDVDVGFLALGDLVENKRASGRAKDLTDIALLEERGLLPPDTGEEEDP